MQVLNSKNFDEQLKELKHTPFAIKTNRGVPVLEQTKHNKVRRDLLEGLTNYLRSVLEQDDEPIYVYETKDGVAIEVENDSVLAEETGNGMITLMLDLSILNLGYDAVEEANFWEEDKAAKLAKAEEIAKKKQKRKTKNEN